MSQTKDNLPITFRSFESLAICGNTLSRGRAPFLFGDTVPLLVGVGERSPLVWLSAPIDAKGTKWTDLIAASRGLVPAVRVYGAPEKGEISILVNRLPVLECKQISEQGAEISFIDLRPCNLNVFGENQTLSVGRSHFSHNSFASDYMMKLG